jgi:hypothetical protein
MRFSAKSGFTLVAALTAFFCYAGSALATPLPNGVSRHANGLIQLTAAEGAMHHHHHHHYHHHYHHHVHHKAT